MTGVTRRILEHTRVSLEQTIHVYIFLLPNSLMMRATTTVKCGSLCLFSLFDSALFTLILPYIYNYECQQTMNHEYL